MATVQQLMSLEGRVSVITGGATGLGLQMAHALAEAGSHIVISSRKLENCEAAAHEIEKIGVKALAVGCDVTKADQVEAMKDAVLKKFGRVDVLVNNAGRAWVAPPEDMPLDRWQQVLDLNITAPFLCAQALGREMIKAKRGKIINIASIDGISVNPWETYSYSASKAGVIHLTKRMSLEMIKDGICVNAIAPGAFASEMNREARDHGDATAQTIPARRIGKDEDMAAAAIYLSSNASDYVVGHTLVVDGGVTLARG